MPETEDVRADDAQSTATKNGASLNRRRLTSVVELARIYADLGVGGLAEAVGRDKTRIIPPTGNPKLDMIDSLAAILEWTVADVVNALDGGPKARDGVIQVRAIKSCRRLERLQGVSRKLKRSGINKWGRVASEIILLNARDGRERAIAHEMLALAQIRNGRLDEALGSLRKGLHQENVEFSTRLELKVQLCRTHLLLHHHVEARSVATDVLGMIEDSNHQDAEQLRNAERTARYVRGNAVRACIDHEIGNAALLLGRKDLVRCLQITKTAGLDGIDEATVSLGAILEIDTALGKVTMEDALLRVEDALLKASTEEEQGTLAAEQRRAWAWWGVFGARIALRAVKTDASWRKAFTFAQKTIEFGAGPEDALLRATGYRLSFEAWKRARARGHGELAWHLEPIQLKLFVQTMGARIGFMEPGWRILEESGTLKRAKSMDPRTWRKGFERG